jgi:hypothetical protein
MVRMTPEVVDLAERVQAEILAQQINNDFDGNHSYAEFELDRFIKVTVHHKLRPRSHLTLNLVCYGGVTRAVTDETGAEPVADVLAELLVHLLYDERGRAYVASLEAPARMTT